MAQLSYSINPAAGTAGMLADNSHMEIISKLASGVVNVGLLCAWGSSGYAGTASANPGTVSILPDSLGDPIPDSAWAGVVMADPTLMPQGVGASMTVGQYADKDTVPVVRFGRIWVVTETAVTEGVDVYVRTTTGTGAQVKGTFRAGASAGFSLFSRGRWRQTTTASGIAVLEIW